MNAKALVVIGLLEAKVNGVCDSLVEHDKTYVMEMRVVRETFEYVCSIVVDKETMSVLNHEYLWGWHSNRKASYYKDTKFVFAGEKTVAGRAATKPSIQNIPIGSVIRRRVLENA